MSSCHRIAVATALIAATAIGARAGEAVPGDGELRAEQVQVPAQVLTRVDALLAERIAAAGLHQTPTLVLAQKVTWPDGSLGCGRPGASSTQALVPGYRLVYAVGPRRFEYHASDKGTVIPCDRPPPIVPPFVTPSDL